uniref:Receptor-transporting protein 3 n=1 Tax=Anoplopoma fimbria TaxID=229290 RepID=C3KK40_ANOFI|nr:Receptor-transporting protein 3 [Anoplopoma fimbria]
MGQSTDWVPSLWMDTFAELLDDDDDSELDYGDQWSLNFNYSLTDKLSMNERKKGWKIYCYSGFANFQCASCSKVWHSAKVTLLFHYRLRSERGSVIMRPFGQACRSCNNNQFELPGFSQEEVERALLRLFAKIRKNCYGEEQDSDDCGPVDKKFTKPHEKSLCQACSQGICCQEDDDDDDD